MKNQLIKTKFIKINHQNKWFKLSLFISIILLFITMFLVSIFNNGLTFISANNIIDETLLKTLVALSTGFGLAVSGSAMQASTRNELAGPTTLGFLPASTLGVLIYEIIDFPSIPLMIFFSFLFAFITLFINFLTCRLTRNDIKGYKMILVGIILGSLISSISIILTNIMPKLNQNIIPWIGSVGFHYDWEKANYSLPIILISVFVIFLISDKLNIIEKDPYLAKSLGINIDLIYWITGIASLLITVSSIILIGSLTMIGIVMPHLIRMLFKTKNYQIISPMSGLLSSTLVMFSFLMNSQWSIGINFFTTILSTPVFLYLILRKKDNKNDD